MKECVSGVYLHYVFPDGMVFIVRMHELFGASVPAILATLIDLHGQPTIETEEANATPDSHHKAPFLFWKAVA